MIDTLERVEAKPDAPPPPPATKPPQHAPQLHIAGISMGRHTLVFLDKVQANGLPKGAVRLELFFALTDERGDAPLAKARYWRSFVKSPIQIEFDQSADKKTATYYARWANENGDVGPWSQPVSKTIAT